MYFDKSSSLENVTWHSFKASVLENLPHSWASPVDTWLNVIKLKLQVSSRSTATTMTTISHLYYHLTGCWVSTKTRSDIQRMQRWSSKRSQTSIQSSFSSVSAAPTSFKLNHGYNPKPDLVRWRSGLTITLSVHGIANVEPHCINY